MPFEQHFGLADIGEIDALKIHWPSGLIQQFGKLGINKTYQFTEGETDWKEIYLKVADV